jgi:HPt (histidine-containing phosphotransfer) domain-containing protein
MDDYISKPVYLEELRLALQRAASRPSTTPAAAREQQPPPLDRAVLERLLARRSGRELLDLYAQESRGIVTKLREAVARGDANETREAAHSLKGSSGYVGASQVARLSAELEQAARAGTLDRVELLLADLEHEFSRACETIDALQQ